MAQGPSLVAFDCAALFMHIVVKRTVARGVDGEFIWLKVKFILSLVGHPLFSEKGFLVFYNS